MYDVEKTEISRNKNFKSQKDNVQKVWKIEGLLRPKDFPRSWHGTPSIVTLNFTRHMHFRKHHVSMHYPQGCRLHYMKL